jgi:hypothetical protein
LPVEHFKFLQSPAITFSEESLFTLLYTRVQREPLPIEGGIPSGLGFDMLLESTRGKYLLAILHTPDSIGEYGDYFALSFLCA